MGYEEALAKSWLDLEEVTKDKKFSVELLSDTYEVDAENNRVLSLSCNAQAQDHVSILILHYLAKKIKGLAPASGEWTSFRELDGGEGYFAAFKKRVIERIARKYGKVPQSLFDLGKRFKAEKSELVSNGIAVQVFEQVPVLITIEPADEEFGPEANILFDKNIKDIFCTEDVVVLSEFIVSQI